LTETQKKFPLKQQEDKNKDQEFKQWQSAFIIRRKTATNEDVPAMEINNCMKMTEIQGRPVQLAACHSKSTC